LILSDWTGVIADILPGDTVAQQIFAAINGSALNYPPAALNNGAPNMAGYDQSDPQCWWTATGCKAVRPLPADLVSPLTREADPRARPASGRSHLHHSEHLGLYVITNSSDCDLTLATQCPLTMVSTDPFFPIAALMISQGPTCAHTPCGCFLPAPALDLSFLQALLPAAAEQPASIVREAHLTVVSR
jgi:hypothetical protein